MSEELNISKLGEIILETNKINGWKVLTPDDWDKIEYKIPAVIALIHSEASEALEAYRVNDKENFIEEMADIVIRVLDCTTGLKMDLEKAITKKLKKNKSRGFRHGGKKL